VQNTAEPDPTVRGGQRQLSQAVVDALKLQAKRNNPHLVNPWCDSQATYMEPTLAPATPPATDAPVAVPAAADTGPAVGDAAVATPTAVPDEPLAVPVASALVGAMGWAQVDGSGNPTRFALAAACAAGTPVPARSRSADRQGATAPASRGTSPAKPLQAHRTPGDVPHITLAAEPDLDNPIYPPEQDSLITPRGLRRAGLADYPRPALHGSGNPTRYELAAARGAGTPVPAAADPGTAAPDDSADDSDSESAASCAAASCAASSAAAAGEAAGRVVMPAQSDGSRWILVISNDEFEVKLSLCVFMVYT
jgi:hypothetical protein